MGIRAQRQILTALAAALLLASAAAADDAPATSTSAPAALPPAATSTAAPAALPPSPLPEAPIPETPPRAAPLPPPLPAAAGPDASARAVSSLQQLAAAYSQKRRTVFMKLVSDDYTGDLGTLEDALSSDFRAYRTIVLSVIPGQTTTRGVKSQIQFRFDITLTDDLGKTNKFSGQAAYTFVDENGKSRLLQMDRTPIFGTSLSSVENPTPTSQGAPTAPVTSAPGCNTTTISGNGVANADGASSYNFATQSAGFSGSGDINYSPGTVFANGSARIVDMGPCNFSTLTTPPAAINDTSDSAIVGDCYAVRTVGGKFAAFKILSLPASQMNFQFKFQPSGARCF